MTLPAVGPLGAAIEGGGVVEAPPLANSAAGLLGVNEAISAEGRCEHDPSIAFFLPALGGA